jgi:hypothetical protein
MPQPRGILVLMRLDFLSVRLIFPEEDRAEGCQLEFELMELFLKDLIVNQVGSR